MTLNEPKDKSLGRQEKQKLSYPGWKDAQVSVHLAYDRPLQLVFQQLPC